MPNFTTSAAGRSLIQQFESCRLRAYPDPGTGGAPYTCGWGSTGPDVTASTVWDQATADARFCADLRRFEAGVNQAATAPINQHMFDALVAFAYNCGLGNLRGSTLLKLLNAGDYHGAANQFARWNKAAGKVLPGLTRRRAAEAALFLTPYG